MDPMAQLPRVLQGDAVIAVHGGGELLRLPRVEELFVSTPTVTPRCPAPGERELWSPRKTDPASLLRAEMQQLEQRLLQQMSGLSAGTRALAGQLRHETEQREADVEKLRQELAGRAAGYRRPAEAGEGGGAGGAGEALAALEARSRQQEQHVWAALSMLERHSERLVSQAAVLDQHSVSVAELRQADAEALLNFQKLEEGRVRLHDEVAALAKHLGLDAPGEAFCSVEAEDTQQQCSKEGQELPPESLAHIAACVERERLAREASEGALQNRLGLLEQRLGGLGGRSQCQRYYIGSPDLSAVSKPERSGGAELEGGEVRRCRTAEDLAAALARAAAGAAAAAAGKGPAAGGGSEIAGAVCRAQTEPSSHVAGATPPGVLGSSELEDKFESMHDAVDQLWRKVCGKPADAARAGGGSSPQPVSSPCFSASDVSSTGADSFGGTKLPCPGAVECALQELRSPLGSTAGTESTVSTAAASLADGFVKLAPPWELLSPGGLAAAARELHEENAALRGALLRLVEDPRLHDRFQSIDGLR